MRRRQFLREGLLPALAATWGTLHTTHSGSPAQCFAATPPAATPNPVNGRHSGTKLKLSCAAYSFRKELSGDSPTLSLMDFVDFCAAQELDATELTSYYFRRTDTEYLNALKRRAYVNGLAISGTPVGNNFCKPDPVERRKDVDHVKKWIDHVVQLGAQTIRVFGGTAAKGMTEASAKAHAIEGLRESARYAGERGVLLALENHGGITRTASDVVELVRAVDSPWLGVNLDTGNFHTEDPYHDLEIAAPYAVSVQVKVMTRAAGGVARPVDFDRVVQILRAAGYRGYLALEYEKKEDARLAVPKHLDALRQAIARPH